MTYAPPPRDRALRTQGHHDGEHGNPSRAKQYSGAQRASYERGYGQGYTARYRTEYERKFHANHKIGPAMPGEGLRPPGVSQRNLPRAGFPMRCKQ